MYTSLRNPPAADVSGLAPAESGRGRASSATVVLLGLTSLFTDMSSEMVTAVLPLYLTVQLGLSPAQFGTVDGLYQGVSAVSRLAAGMVSDRLHAPKAVAASGYALSALVRPLFLLTQSLASIGTLISIDRIGKGIRTAPRDALIAANSAPGRLGFTFGVHRALDTVGAMLGPLIAFAALRGDPQGYDTVFVFSCAFALLGLAVLVVFVPGRRATDHRPRVTPGDIGRLVRSGPFVRISVVAGLLALFTVSDAFLYLALLDRHAVVAALFPLLPVATSLAYLVLSVPFGSLADRLGRRRVFLFGHCLLLGGYAGAAGPFGDVVAVLAVLGFLGAHYAATDGVLSALAVPVLPQRLRGSGLAALQTTVALVNLVSSIAFGLLLVMVSQRTAYAVMGLGTASSLGVGTVLLSSPSRRVVRR